MPSLIVGLILIVGIAGTVLAIRAHESDSQFISSQEHLASVEAPQLQELISTTSDPRPGSRYTGRARSARCVSHGKGALANPWSCVVDYPRPPAISYQVTVHADRSIVGSGQPIGKPVRGRLIVRGCCVAQGAL
jgi:hypothetical protein